MESTRLVKLRVLEHELQCFDQKLSMILKNKYCGTVQYVSITDLRETKPIDEVISYL